MALTNDQIVAKNFKEFYTRLLPFLKQSEPDNGFTPVGTVITVMGSHAPKNYLLCDGTVYSLAEYPNLASFFETEFGSSNYFGGDGTTTFAVPDLTGTNLTDGCFCIAYKNILIRTSGGGGTGDYNDLENLPQIESVELKGNVSLSTLGIQPELTAGDGVDISAANEITLDPMPAADLSNILTPLPSATSTVSRYSTEEQVVGEWIDGKPIYQKTINFGAMPNNTTKQVNSGITDVENVINIYGVMQNNLYAIIIPDISSNSVYARLYYNKTNNQVAISNSFNQSEYSAYITLQYTKTTD